MESCVIYVNFQYRPATWISSHSLMDGCSLPPVGLFTERINSFHEDDRTCFQALPWMNRQVFFFNHNLWQVIYGIPYITVPSALKPSLSMLSTFHNLWRISFEHYSVECCSLYISIFYTMPCYQSNGGLSNFWINVGSDHWCIRTQQDIRCLTIVSWPWKHQII